MSIVAKLYLQPIADAKIDDLNLQLKTLGYPVPVFDGVLYGPFPSVARLEHYASWLTNDAEGLKELSHFERPITRSFLESFPWMMVGCFYVTLTNSMTQKEREECLVVYEFAYANPELFDWARSNASKQLLTSCGFRLS